MKLWDRKTGGGRGRNSSAPRCRNAASDDPSCLIGEPAEEEEEEEEEEVKEEEEKRRDED